MTQPCKDCNGIGVEWFGTYDQQDEPCMWCGGKGWEYENEEEEWDDIALMEESEADNG